MRNPGQIRFFRAGNIYVVEKDLSPGGVEWQKIPELIEEFKKIYPGYDFRLPSVKELWYLIRLKNFGIGNFKENSYWASMSEDGFITPLNFGRGLWLGTFREFEAQSYYLMVRLVVDI